MVSKPLTEWSREDVDQLIGRREGQFLEAKGADLDLATPEGRRSIARAVAGLASAMGGLIVVGAEEKDQLVTALPGVAAGPDAEGRLRAALLDLLIPIPSFRVRAFPQLETNDLGKRAVLLITVGAEPGGRPVMVRDRGFFVRAEDRTVPMPYLDIERRMSLTHSRVERVRSEAIEFAGRILGTSPTVEATPLRVVSIPLFAIDDLHRTGSDLQEIWWEVEGRVNEAWEAVDRIIARRLPHRHGLHTTGHGLVIDGERLRYEIDHRGRAGAALAIDSAATEFEPFPSPYEVLPLVVTIFALFLAAQRELGLSGPVYVRLQSGRLSGTALSDARDIGNDIDLDGQIPLWGDTAEASERVLTIFLTRIADHARRSFGPLPDAEVQLLRRMLPETGLG